MSDPRSHLWNAIRKGDIKLVRVLLEGGEVNVNDSYVHGEGGAEPPGNISTFLCHACDVGKLDIVELLVEKGASLNLQEANLTKEYPLWYAARSGNVSLASFLADKGANVRQTNANGTTPMHKAMEVGDRQASVELTELFLAHGAEVDAKNRWGNTPAHLAARCNNVDALRVLIARGADITCKNNDGNTVYDRALHYGSEAIRDFILRRAAGRISHNKCTPAFDATDGETAPSILQAQIEELQYENSRLQDIITNQEKRLDELQENYSDLRAEMAEIRNKVFGKGTPSKDGATATPMSERHSALTSHPAYTRHAAHWRHRLLVPGKRLRRPSSGGSQGADHPARHQQETLGNRADPRRPGVLCLPSWPHQYQTTTLSRHVGGTDLDL
ncbi:ankyrin repeat domain-containing protein 50-like [Branchiostoma floridae]|uniref:Ankyrin repeat domain-containing protein 50-like n=2 Tax=Branchiostoma floridae TaxID=7739 RepID=A0A9J7KSP5_BRAFL|nr:ankyrin repeat domain-containing protein 50-like [Branchiostoma floridae]